MKYDFTEQEVGNLTAFLNRVAIQGHQEREAMNQICYKLANPIKEEQEQEVSKE